MDVISIITLLGPVCDTDNQELVAIFKMKLEKKGDERSTTNPLRFNG